MLSLGKGMVKIMLIRGFSGQTNFGPFCFLTAPHFGLFSRQELKSCSGAESWELDVRSWNWGAGCLQGLNLTVEAICAIINTSSEGQTLKNQRGRTLCE